MDIEYDSYEEEKKKKEEKKLNLSNSKKKQLFVNDDDEEDQNDKKPQTRSNQAKVQTNKMELLDDNTVTADKNFGNLYNLTKPVQIKYDEACVYYRNKKTNKFEKKEIV